MTSHKNTEQSSDRYLNLMNFDSAEQAYAEVKQLASGLSDDEHLVRSCIFDLHAAIELELRRIYYHTFKTHLFLTDDEKQNDKVTKDFSKKIERLGFMDMYRVLRPCLNSWPYPEFAYIQDINNARNAAAHSDAIESVNYKGRNPFKDADCFAQMYFDVWAIKQNMAKYFDYTIEKQSRTLKRYIDKYGSGGI